LIIELGGPNYAKVGAKMIELEGKKVDVPDATERAPIIDTLGLKFLPDVKEIFDKPPVR
jgi:hypothetical protein